MQIIRIGFWVGIVLATAGAVCANSADEGWKLVFEDDFERSELGPRWGGGTAYFSIERGALTGKGEIFLRRQFPGDQRLEYTGWVNADQAEPCDLSAVLCSTSGTLDYGYFLGFGSEYNTMNKFVRRGKIGTTLRSPLIVPGRKHHVVCQRLEGRLTWWVDGKKVFEHDDPEPLKGPRVGLYLFHPGRIDDVKVFGRGETVQTASFGAQYAGPEGEQPAEEVTSAELARFVPSSAAGGPVDGQYVAQLTHDGKPFHPIGFYGDWGYLPMLPTSLEELAANGFNLLLSRDVCQRVDPRQAQKDPQLKRKFDARQRIIRMSLDNAEQTGFVYMPKLDTEWSGLVRDGNTPDGWTPRDEYMIVYNVRRLRHEPAVWGFYLEDEPDHQIFRKAGLDDQTPLVGDWYTESRAATQVAHTAWYYNLVKSLAPHHQLMQCFTRIVAIGMDGCDIHNPATYPISRFGDYPDHKLYGVAQFARETGLACKYYGGGKKSFIFSPQAYDRFYKERPHSGKGTLLENRYVAFAPLTEGGQGTIYWCLWWATRDLLETKLFPIARDLKRMEPYLLGEWHNEMVSSDHDQTIWAPLKAQNVRDPLMIEKLTPLADVSHCMRKQGEEYLLLAVNNTKFTKKVTFTIDDLPAGSHPARDFFTGEQVSIESGQLVADFEPYDTRAFVMYAQPGSPPLVELHRSPQAAPAELPPFGVDGEDEGWQLQFAESFDGDVLADVWVCHDDRVGLENGGISGPGPVELARDFPGEQRIDYTLTIEANQHERVPPNGVWLGSDLQFNTGYYIRLGYTSDEADVMLRAGMGAAQRDWDPQKPLLEVGNSYQIRFQRAGGRVSCLVDGEVVLEYLDEQPLTGNRLGLVLMSDSRVDEVKVYTRQ